MLFKSIAICFLLFAVSQSQFAEDYSYVTELELNNFHSVVDDLDLSMIFFYAPWCGACKKFAPVFEEAAKIGHDRFNFLKFNAWNESHIPINQEYNVSSYPTLIILRKGDVNVTHYNEDRSADQIIKKLSIMARPVAPKLQSDQIESYIANNAYDQISIIGFFSSETSDEYTSFSHLATSLRDSHLFAIVITNELLYEIQSLPSVRVFKNHDNEMSNITTDFANLESWIFEQQFPLIDSIGKHNSKLYVNSGMPIAFFFAETQGQRDLYKGMLKDLAKEFKMRVVFVFIDWVKYGEQATKLGLSGKKVPALALENTKTKYHWAYDENKELTVELISQWLTNILENNFPPTIVSQPRPTENNGPVREIVASDFEEIVINNGDNVFVEFYAPWCGHCKQLAPVWEELGNAFANQSRVVIAKMDAVNNDVNPNYGISMYPKLMLFKAGNKANPIVYDSKDRSLDSLVAFLKEELSAGKEEVKEKKKDKKKKEKKDDDDDDDSDDDDDDREKQYKKEKKEKKKQEKKEKKDKKKDEL